MDDEYEILLIGKTGDGKSTLGNFLLNDNGIKHFKPFDTSNSGTQSTNEKKIGDLTVIDTPGLLDSGNTAGENDVDAEHYKDMVQFIKKRQNLKGILIVKDSNNIRFSADIQEMIKMICNTFDNPKIFKNIAFVFTKFYMKRKQKDEVREKAKTDFVDNAKKLIEDFYKSKIKDLQYTFESFFIDSDMEDPDEESELERIKLYGWVRGLSKINTKELPNKDMRYKKLEEDYETEIEVEEDDDYIIRKTKFFTIKKATDLNDKTSIIEKKYKYTLPTKIPKKKSLWKKILGGIAVGVGIIAAPFTGGASLALSAGGVGTIISGEIDDVYNKSLRENCRKN